MHHRAYASAERLVEGMNRTQACSRYRRKVDLIARRVSDRLPSDAAIPLEDLAAWGAIGLIEAFDRFDAGRGIKFSTYAEYRIRGAIYDALRTQDTFSRRRRQLAKRVETAREEIRRQTGREPSANEVSEFLDMDLDTYHRAIDRTKPTVHMSLDDQGPDNRPLSDMLMSGTRSPDAALVVQEVRAQLREAIASLPERERHCIMMYYGKDMSLAEISAVYEVTVSRISQILSKARGRLRKRLAPFIEGTDLSELERAG